MLAAGAQNSVSALPCAGRGPSGLRRGCCPAKAQQHLSVTAGQGPRETNCNSSRAISLKTSVSVTVFSTVSFALIRRNT